jgi:hypothetical protein
MTLRKPIVDVDGEYRELPDGDSVEGVASGVEFQFPSASTTWIINHNLGYHPAVQLRSVGNVVIGGDVSHPSINQARVDFAGAIAGSARCN